MKPNFALSLSFDGISLLHRAAGGWREVGEVSVASEDLAAELAMLRQTAVGLEPGGVRSKLIIPEGQIKYLTIETPGLSTAARKKEAAKALENATPYAVADLVFDISQDGPLTHIAAVARETLEEAESFAEEHRFHPVSFVAVPGPADYLGEPFFGTTAIAEDLLDSGEEVEPDGIAVVVIGTIEPLQDMTAEPEAQALDPTDGTAAAAPEMADDPIEAAPAHKETNPTQETAADSTPETPEAPDDGDTGTEVSAEQDEAATETAVQSKAAEPAPKPMASGGQPKDSLVAAVAHASKSQAKPVENSPAAATPAPRKPTVSATRTVSAPAPEADASGFASRRATLGGASRAAPRITPQPDSSSLTQTPEVAESVAATPEKTGFFSRRKPRKGAAAPKPAPSAAVPAPDTEVERMTVFGARSSEVGGKPRFLGLILTVVLLVFLAGVAAWAAVFLDEGIAGLLRKDNGRATASAPENQVAPQVILDADATTEGATPVSDTQVAALDPVLSAEDGAVLDALQTARPVPEIPVITPQEAAARYAVSGIWPLAPANLPERPDIDADAVFRNGIDGTSGAVDAIALPAPERFGTDIELAAVPSPPPFGQKAGVRPDGLLIPTEDGIVTPQGYTLIAASPPVKPPLPPTRFTTSPDELTDQPETAAPVAEAPQTNAVLAAFRPLLRPSGLAETTERAQLGGVTRLELAAFRPALRPRSLQDRARQADLDRQAEEQARATAAAQAAPAAAAAALALPPAAPAAPALENATRFAVAQSRRPDTRPRNFDRIVKRAQRASPQRETRVAAAATVAPRTVAPKIPSKASVARSATVKNAINLRKVNLIGVYGKPASRRALVRLSNGRYKKVKVGDRIDGGRVSAIGDGELRYTKGGRNVVLKMPRG